MAKYDINYSCGHGSVEKQLFGKHDERERKIKWMESNMLCPSCYKEKIKKQDDEAEKKAFVTLDYIPDNISIKIELSGQIEKNKEEFKKLGYYLGNSSSGGVLDSIFGGKESRSYQIKYQIKTEEDIKGLENWFSDRFKELSILGYKPQNTLSAIDLEFVRNEVLKIHEKSKQEIEKKEKLEEVLKTDPKPEISPLRKRIKEIEEKENSKWNGKIYGKKGDYNFYVNNKKYNASDNEVEERERINKEIDKWKERNKDLMSKGGEIPDLTKPQKGHWLYNSLDWLMNMTKF
jgi:hypothetical protein